MNNKVLTNTPEVFRWILLPFACLILPVIAAALVAIFLTLIKFLSGFNPSDILFMYFKDITQAFTLGFIFVKTTLYLAPKHTRTAMLITRTIGFIGIIIFIGFVIYATFYASNFGILDLINSIILSISIFAGMFIKMEDEERIISQEEESSVSQ